MVSLRRTMKAPTIAFPAAACAAATLLFGTLLQAPAADTQARSSEAGFASLERQFHELPPEARRQTGPLFWLHGDDSKERLEMYVGKVAEGGNGSFTTESRPHTDWLGAGWWRDLDICLAAAKKQNLQLWIFDEKWWPSQAVAGKVPPRYAAKRLEAATVEVEGPRTFEAEGYNGERYVAAVAGQVSADGKIDGDTLVDLAPHIRAGKLSWQAPAGKWRIMKFTQKQAPGLLQAGRHRNSAWTARARIAWIGSSRRFTSHTTSITRRISARPSAASSTTSRRHPATGAPN